MPAPWPWIIKARRHARPTLRSNVRSGNRAQDAMRLTHEWPGLTHVCAALSQHLLLIVE